MVIANSSTDSATSMREPGEKSFPAVCMVRPIIMIRKSCFCTSRCSRSSTPNSGQLSIRRGETTTEQTDLPHVGRANEDNDRVGEREEHPRNQLVVESKKSEHGSDQQLMRNVD